EVDAAQLIETVKQLPAPPPIERPRDTAAGPASSAVARDTPKPTQGNTGGPATTAGPATGGRVGDARAHQISSQLAAMEMQVLTGLNSSGPATNAVLDQSGSL